MHRGLRAPADGPRPGRGQPRDQGLRRPGHRRARARRAARGRGRRAGRRGALPHLADRARPRAPRPGHRRRDARAAARPRGPVADPVAGGGVPRAARRDRAPGLAAAGQRVGALRVGVRRARPARVPGGPADGRGAGQQLHGLRRPGRARARSTSGSGDEAWDLDHFLHENPELKRAPFVWMTDFVGWVPMPDGGEREAFLTSDYNAEMVEHVARYPSLRDRSVFVGDPADVVDLPLGPDLPTARAWTEEHFDFAGYVMGERPDPADRDGAAAAARVRRRRGRLRGQRRRFGRRRPPAAARGRVVRRGAAPHPRPADGGGRRPADRPGLAGRARGRGGARLPARPRPAPRRVRRGRRPGRAEHHDGAHRRRSAVPVLPARPPLRAAGARAAPAGAAPGRSGDGLPRRRPGPDRRRAGRGAEGARPTTCPVPTDGADAGGSAGARAALSRQPSSVADRLPGPRSRPQRRRAAAASAGSPGERGSRAAGSSRRPPPRPCPGGHSTASRSGAGLGRHVAGSPVSGRQRGQAPQPPASAVAGLAGRQPAPGDGLGLGAVAGLDQRGGQQPGGDGVPPRVVDRRGSPRRPRGRPDGRSSRSPASRANQPSWALQVAGVGRVAAEAVELQRLGDQGPGVVQAALGGGHERRLEHRPLQQPGVAAGAEPGLELGDHLAEPVRVAQVGPAPS